MMMKNKMKKFRDEVQKNWDLPVDKLINKLDKQYEKLNEPVYDLSLGTQLILRYFNIYKYRFEATDGIFQVDENGKNIPVSETPSYDHKYKTVWEWAIKKYISTWKEFLFGILILGLELKEWVNQEYEINYLQQLIKDIENQLENKDTSGDNIFFRIKTENAIFKINNLFKQGIYPDVFTTDPDMISMVEAMIAIRRYLKEQVTIKQPSNLTEQVVIQGDIKGKKDNLGNLTVTLPLKEIKESLIEEVKKETIRIPLPNQDKKDKLYTRKETAEMMGVSTVTLDKWVKQGIITAYRVGNKQIRFRIEDIKKAIKEIKAYKF